jgi:Core-2/I-Branching enzyme
MLVHQNPRLLKRAIGTLSSEDSAFFIHVDGKSDIQSFTDIGGSNVFFAERRVAINWGEFSMVQATLQLLRHALERPEGYDYFVLLSGSDYPLRGGNYIRKFLEVHRGEQFMSAVKMPAPGYPLSKINLLRYSSDKPVRRFAARALAKVGLAQRDHRKHLRRLQPYSGSQWWTISRDASRYIVEFTTSNPHLEKYFRNTFTSDEMFFHTILANSSFQHRLRRNLVYLDWPRAGKHPAMLNDTHVAFFEAQEEVCVNDEWGSGEVLFARKFSDDSLPLLDRIDKMIQRKDQQIMTSLSSSNRSSRAQ